MNNYRTAGKYWQDYYGSLNGAVIIKFNGFTIEEGILSDFPSFDVRLKNGERGTIEISQDEEGNGGGFIFGLPRPN